LTCSVPYLQAYFLFTNEDGFGLEINADSGEMGSHEVVLAEFEQHVRLAYSAITDHQQFD
jgi:hypothetical protein